MLSLSLENLSSKIKERAPLFHSVLSTFAINPHSRATYMKPHFGPIAMAAPILLKNRSRYMTAIQLLVTIFLYHSNWMVSLIFFSKLHLNITLNHWGGGGVQLMCQNCQISQRSWVMLIVHLMLIIILLYKIPKRFIEIVALLSTNQIAVILSYFNVAFK